MRDRFDRAVTGVLAACVLICAGAAVSLRPAPLPVADASRWIALAKTSLGRQPVYLISWQIDAIDAGPQHLGYPAQLPPIRAGERLAIAGWALDPARRRTAAGVDYRIDRGPWRPAQYHLPRPDVAVTKGLTGSADSGYAAVVPTGALAPGTHTLELAVTGAHGRQAMTPTVRFTVAPN